jgi:hypothetical protein
MAWTFLGDGTFRRWTGELEFFPNIVKLLQSRSANGADYLLQPKVHNHEAIRDLSGQALATVRLLTLRTPSGEITPLLAYFRMATGTSHTDNFSSGGVAAPVDVIDGVLGHAVTNKHSPLARTSRHPDSGTIIAGRALPYWHEALQLAVDAHGEFAEFFVVGWDIAITDNGALLVEGNDQPGVDIQFINGVALGYTPFPRIANEWLNLRGSVPKV